MAFYLQSNGPKSSTLQKICSWNDIIIHNYKDVRVLLIDGNHGGEGTNLEGDSGLLDIQQ